MPPFYTQLFIFYREIYKPTLQRGNKSVAILRLGKIMYHYLDHLVATLVIFVLLILLERIIHRTEPEHTTVELFIAAVGNAFSIPLTIAAITITYMLLVLLKQPNAIPRASYWPVEILRLVTRRKSRRQSIQ